MISIGGSKKAALMNCGCCGCDGACFPESCVGDVCTLLDVPWEITAPSCPAIDGMTGNFSPFGGYSSYDRSECGPCVCYEAITELSLPGKIYLELGGGGGVGEEGGGGGGGDPPPTCVESPCTIDLKLYLAIDASIPGCCRVVVVVELLSVVDGLALTSGDVQTPETLNCIPQATPVDNDRFRQFEFDSCTCLPDRAGFTALFDLSRITWECTLGNHPPSSLCYPNSLCCVLDGCSLAGATLTI